MIVHNLKRILLHDPVDWAAFDATLRRSDDINAIDEEEEESILSDLLDELFYDYNRRFDERFLPEVIRHFLACGYDVRANGGKNGGYALCKLCWSNCGKDLPEAFKLLLDAGAPTCFPYAGSDKLWPGSEVVNEILWRENGAWYVHQEYEKANVLGACRAIVEAYEAGREYRSITSFYDCIGETVTGVEAIGASSFDNPAADRAVAEFDDRLVLWFGEKPLVIDKSVCMVVNPLVVRDRESDRSPAAEYASRLTGGRLLDVTYVDLTTCFLDFDNGKRLIVSNFCSAGELAVGLCELRETETEPELCTVEIDAICMADRHHYASHVVDYSDAAVAAFGSDSAHLIYAKGFGEKACRLRLLKCSRELARHFSRMLPLGEIEKPKLFTAGGRISAIRFPCGPGFLYLKANAERTIDLMLSGQEFNPNVRFGMTSAQGIHMEFSPYDFGGGK